MALPAGAEFIQTGNQSVRVSGTGEAGTKVTLQVFKEGYTPESLKNLPDGTTYLDVLAAHDQTKVAANGTYTFDFNIDGQSGTYTAYTSFEGNAAAASETLFFIDRSEVISVLAELHAANVATSAEVLEAGDTSVEDIIKNSHKKIVLGFTDEKGVGINTASLAKILFNYINKDGSDFTHDDRNAAIAVYEQCLYVQRLNESKITNIFDEYALSLIDASEVKEWVAKPFVTENLKREMTAKLSGKGFTKIEDYKEKITEAFVLATVKYPNGYTNLEDVLKEFYSQAGINLSDITGDICSTISGNTYNSYQELQTAFTPTLPDGGEGGSDDFGSNDGGGGGGGGGTGSKDKKPVDVGIAIPAPEAPTPVPEKAFSDIETVSWAEEAILALADEGIINGKGNGKFCPDDMVTREEFTKMIMEALNVEKTGNVTFADVDKDAWYYPYISGAYEAGIIKGIDASNFGTGRNISRQDMAVICLNAAKSAGLEIPGISGEAFSDDSAISDYAKNAVYTLKQMQIIGGMGDNTYQPQGFATRAQAAVIIYRILSI